MAKDTGKTRPKTPPTRPTQTNKESIPGKKTTRQKPKGK